MLLTEINKLGERLKQFRICDAAIELYRLKPEPRDMGSYVLTFREYRKKKGVVLQCGLTKYGVDTVVQAFRERTIRPEVLLTKAYRLIDEARRPKTPRKILPVLPWDGLT